MNKLLILSLATTLPALSAMAANPMVSLNWRYRDATTGRLEASVAELGVPAARGATDAVIEKTIFLAKLARTYKSAMAAYADACAALAPP